MKGTLGLLPARVAIGPLHRCNLRLEARNATKQLISIYRISVLL